MHVNTVVYVQWRQYQNERASLHQHCSKHSKNLTTTALKASSVVILHYYCTNKPPCSLDLDDPLAILLLSCRPLISHCPPVSVVTRQKWGTKEVGFVSVWSAASCVVVYRCWRMPLWFIPGHYSSMFLNANWRRWGLCWSDGQPTFLPSLMWETDLRIKGLLLQILQVDKTLKIVTEHVCPWMNRWPPLVSSCYAPSDPGVTALDIMEYRSVGSLENGYQKSDGG